MSNIKIFNDKEIRTYWDEDKEDWFFSVVDVVEVLTKSSNPKEYIKKMRNRDEELSSKWGTICTPVKMTAKDGKMRSIQAADAKGLLRIIQSIPSPNAEPFKMWLAQVGSERLDEIVDPEQSFERGIENYTKKGYSRDWINQRLMSIEVRKELTEEWQDCGVTSNKDYAILTNEMTKAWSGKSVKQYKKHKDLKKENLRDNMTNLELVLNMLAEATTTEISKEEKPKGFNETLNVAKKGGNIAGNTRKEIEKTVGKNIISKANATIPKALDETKKSILIDKNTDNND